MKKGVRRALMMLVPAALLVALVPSGGSAKPTPPLRNFEVCIQNASTAVPAPACSPAGTNSAFSGGVFGAKVKVTITNDSASTVNLASANITAPAQLVVDTAGGAAAPAANVSVSGQTVQVHGLSLRPGSAFAATFFVDTVCPESDGIAWTATAADSSANAFALQAASSTGTTTDLAVGCHLGFVANPVDTQVGQTITDQGGSGGNPVAVGLLKNDGSAMTACPFGNGKCSVAIGRDHEDGLFGGTHDRPMSADGNPLVASFNDLSMTVAAANTPESFQLTATGDGGLAPQVSSNAFNITLYAQSCTNGACNLNQKNLPGSGGAADSFADLSANTGFTFMTLSPLQFATTPAGCANFKSAGVAGVAETDGRQPGAPMNITYYVSMDRIKARYGKNVGSQFIPICAGAKPVVGGVAVDCNTVPNITWVGDELDKNGAFDGHQTNAVCAPDDGSPNAGYLWNILASFQDKIPDAGTKNPFVASWGSTTIGGTTYRQFNIVVPANLDWRAGS